MPTTAAATGPTAGTSPATTRWATAAALALAGILFAAFPTVRPYADETTLAGAATFASDRWVLSHTFGMAAFAAATLGLRGLHLDGRAGRIVRFTAPVGTVLILPFFGAETFGLHVIGAHAVASGDPAVLALAEQLRGHPLALTSFGVGLVLLAGSGASLVAAVRRRGEVLRWGAVLAGAGLVTYLPQFFTPPAARMGHGLVLGLGFALLAVHAARRR